MKVICQPHVPTDLLLGTKAPQYPLKRGLGVSPELSKRSLVTMPTELPRLDQREFDTFYFLIKKPSYWLTKPQNARREEQRQQAICKCVMNL